VSSCRRHRLAQPSSIGVSHAQAASWACNCGNPAVFAEDRREPSMRPGNHEYGSPDPLVDGSTTWTAPRFVAAIAEPSGPEATESTPDPKSSSAGDLMMSAGTRRSPFTSQRVTAELPLAISTAPTRCRKPDGTRALASMALEAPCHPVVVRQEGWGLSDGSCDASAGISFRGTGRGDLAGEEWARLEPHLPANHGGVGAGNATVG
jgi:hypothetical protein